MRPWQKLRQAEALVRHFFPSVDLETIDDHTFAKRVNEAIWLKGELNPFGNIAAVQK